MAREVREGNVFLQGVRAQYLGLGDRNSKTVRMEEYSGKLHKGFKRGLGAASQHKIISEEDARHQLIAKGQPMCSGIENLSQAMNIQAKEEGAQITT